MNHLALSTEYRITSAETDSEARLRPGALLNMLIQSAIQSADVLGFGFKHLQKENLFWVLSRMVLEIQRPLAWYEKAIVRTWPKRIEGLLYIRDCEIADEKGGLVARSTSGWLAIDRNTRRPKQITGDDLVIFELLKDNHAIEAIPEKLPAPPDGPETVIQPSYFDLDLNRHVTSTRYLDWMLDQIDPEYHRDHYPAKVVINYMKETRLEDKIHLRTFRDGNVFSFEGRHETTGNSSFRGMVSFVPVPPRS